MRIEETRNPEGRGVGGSHFDSDRQESRVRDLDKGEDRPQSAVIVPDDTPVHDWQAKE